MAYETVTFVNQLSISAPAGADDRSSTAEHLRLIKYTLKNSFPNVSGAVAVTQAELDTLVGNTLTVWAKLSALSLSNSAYLTDLARLSATVVSLQALADAALLKIPHGTVSFCLSMSTLNLVLGSIPVTTNRIVLMGKGLKTTTYALNNFAVLLKKAGGAYANGQGCSVWFSGGMSTSTDAKSTDTYLRVYPNGPYSETCAVTFRVDIQRTESAGVTWDLTLRGASWAPSGRYATLYGHQRLSVTSNTLDGITLYTNYPASAGFVKAWQED